MQLLTIALLVLIIAMVLSIIGMQYGILIKEMAAKRYYLLLFILMMLATIVSRIILSKTGIFRLGLISGPIILLLGFLPVLYSEYLKKKQAARYTGIWKRLGDWMNLPIKTLCANKNKHRTNS